MNMPILVICIIVYAEFLCLPAKVAACPDKYKNIDGVCYKINLDFYKKGDALQRCEEEGAGLGVFIDNIPKGLNDIVNDYIGSKAKNAYYWIGFRMKDMSTGKKIGERDWTFDIDDDKVVQKDYEFWAEEPTNGALTCAAVNGSLEFKVLSLDCGGPRLPVVCDRTDEPCQENGKAYFQYGDQCLAVIPSAMEYKYIHAACNPAVPVSIKNSKMKDNTKISIVNSFFGGGIFISLEKKPNGEFVYSNGRKPIASLWEEGEPRSQYGCVGLAWQIDGTLKLRSIDCDFRAASVCVLLGNVSHVE